MDASALATLVVTGILTPVIVGYFTMRFEVAQKEALAKMEQQGKDADAKREAARNEQAERSKADSERLDRIENRIEAIEKRLDEQESKMDSTLEAQCTQMRSDITHKIHRYVDDLHCASTEEKQSLWAEYEVYAAVCAKHGIKNHFVEQMVQQAMDLPDRPRAKEER